MVHVQLIGWNHQCNLLRSEHHLKQKQLEAEIADRILKEEQLMRRKKVLYPPLFATPEDETKKVSWWLDTTNAR